MSWNKTIYEGKTCYEQGGQRLFRTQDIDALEEAEKRQSKIDREKVKSDRIGEYDYDDIIFHDNHEVQKNSKYDVVIVVIVIAFFVLMYFIN